jgi:hypothetical protein
MAPSLTPLPDDRRYSVWNQRVVLQEGCACILCTCSVRSTHMHPSTHPMYSMYGVCKIHVRTTEHVQSRWVQSSHVVLCVCVCVCVCVSPPSLLFPLAAYLGTRSSMQCVLAPGEFSIQPNARGRTRESWQPWVVFSLPSSGPVVAILLLCDCD